MSSTNQLQLHILIPVYIQSMLHSLPLKHIGIICMHMYSTCTYVEELWVFCLFPLTCTCACVLSYSSKAAIRHFPVWRTWRSTYAATPEKSPTFASIPAVSRPSATQVIEPNTSAHTWTRYVCPFLCLYQVKTQKHIKHALQLDSKVSEEHKYLHAHICLAHFSPFLTNYKYAKYVFY